MREETYSNKKIARFAGFFYLGLIVFGAFANIFARTNFVVEGNPTETVANLNDNLYLFRIGLASDFIAHLMFFLLALSLYKILKPVSKIFSLSFLLMVCISVAMMGINMLNHFAPLYILTEAKYLSTFTTDQLNSLVLFFLDLHKFGYAMAGFWFAIWLIPLGYVVRKSDFFPKFFGILLIAGGIGYLIDFFRVFLFPDFGSIAIPGVAIATIAEFSFCLWLIFKGAKEKNK